MLLLRNGCRLGAAAFLLASFSTIVSAQAPIWASDWRVAAPTTFPLADATKFAFDGSGDLAVGHVSTSGLDYQFMRMDASGNVRWSVNLGIGFYNETGDATPMLLFADGTAVVAIDQGYSDSSRVAGIAADGSITWIRSLRARRLVPLANQRVAATVCGSVTVLDVVTGHVEWSFGTPTDYTASCIDDIAVGDSDGNIYAIFAIPPLYAPAGVRTMKFDTNGKVLWDVSSTFTTVTPAFWAMIGVSEGMLFENAYTELHVLHAADGSTAWTHPFAGVEPASVVLSGSPPEAIVFDGGSISRLANDTGDTRWSQTSPSVAQHPTALNGDVLAFVSNALMRFDASTGNIVWQTPLPTADADANQLNFIGTGDAGGGVVAAVGVSYALSPQPPFLQKVDFTSGALGDRTAAPGVLQGVSSNSLIEDENHLIDAGVVADSSGWKLHARRLDSASGAVLWETAEPISGFVNWPISLSPLLAVSGGQLAAALPTSNTVEIFDIQTDTGAVRWAKSIPELFAQMFYLNGVVIDSAGNVYVEYSVTYSCSQYFNCCPSMLSSCSALKMYKLAALDGSTLWKRDGPSAYDASPAFALADWDVILSGPFSGDLASSTVVRLSGADGATAIWSSSVLSATGGAYDLQLLPDNTISVLGQGWARLNATTGETLWESPPVADPQCTPPTCYMYEGFVAPNGDTYLVGESNRTLRIERLHGDGSGNADLWYPLPNVAGTRVAGTRIQRDTAGQLWLRMFRSASGPQSLSLLAMFDPASGAVSQQQVIGLYDSSDNLRPSVERSIFSAPENSKVLAPTTTSAPPLPATSGDALLNVAVIAQGDLATSVGIDGDRVTVGENVTFHFFATYSGNAPIVGARLIGGLAWASGLSNVSCATQGATNCIVDARSDNVDATFDIEPGGSIEISGSVQVMAVAQRDDPPVLHSVVFGPPGLVEADTQNNFGSLKISQSLFFNGFE